MNDFSKLVSMFCNIIPDHNSRIPEHIRRQSAPSNSPIRKMGVRTSSSNCVQAASLSTLCAWYHSRLLFSLKSSRYFKTSPISIVRISPPLFLYSSLIEKNIYPSPVCGQPSFLFLRFCSPYSSLIVSVIAIFRIRFVGAYTATAAQVTTNTAITHSIVTGGCHTIPKYRVISRVCRK